MTEAHFPALPAGQFPGLSALEDACIRLKVPHPDIPRWLYDLIVEARRLDAAHAVMQAIIEQPFDGVTDQQLREIPEAAIFMANAYITRVVRPDPEIK